jgi:hypothetical protein
MIECQNCGHESHCGVPLMKDFRREPYNHGIEGQIRVCDHCRCEMCERDSIIINNRNKSE